MAAGVDECVEFVLIVACDEDGLTPDRRGEVVMLVQDLGFMRKEYPITLEEMLHFQIE